MVSSDKCGIPSPQSFLMYFWHDSLWCNLLDGLECNINKQATTIIWSQNECYSHTMVNLLPKLRLFNNQNIKVVHQTISLELTSKRNKNHYKRYQKKFLRAINFQKKFLLPSLQSLDMAHLFHRYSIVVYCIPQEMIMIRIIR